MLDNYERMFGEKPKEYSSPLEKGDHPEIDDSDLIDPKDIPKCQSLIGAAQWAISLGCSDIHTAVMTMSHFRISPRKGHLERMQRIYGYLQKYKDGAIQVQTTRPDITKFSAIEHNWLYSVYGNVHSK
jgi:hypothetical protein